METIEICRTDNEALVFDGEMLAKASSPQCETEDGHRGYEVAIYSRSEGGFVVSIQYLTTCPDEHSVTQAEIVEEPDDVEKVLLVFEPCEYVDRKMLRALSDEQRQKLRRALYRSYDDQVSQVLGAATAHFGNWRLDSAKQEQPRVSEPKRGILSFLRIK